MTNATQQESGRVVVLGLGPGAPEWVTPEVRQALDDVTDIIGYAPYVARIAERPGQIRHASDNRVEIERAQHALQLAAQGRRVAVVSGGDPGIFAMASAILEAVAKGDPAWRELDIVVMPGISAMQAVAARLGAPLGHDFCAISLSDNLKPWDVVVRRLQCAAEADFVISLYNPASKARPDRIHEALEILRRTKAGTTPVIFARAVGRPDEAIMLTTLAQADAGVVDMSTLVMIGSSETKLIERCDKRPFVYTPRTYGVS